MEGCRDLCHLKKLLCHTSARQEQNLTKMALARTKAVCDEQEGNKSPFWYSSETLKNGSIEMV